MQLIKLSANKSSFHPVNFCKGINIIVGKKVTLQQKMTATLLMV